MISISDNYKLTYLLLNQLKVVILCFYSNQNFTNIGLTNFGKSLKNLLELHSISFFLGV